MSVTHRIESFGVSALRSPDTAMISVGDALIRINRCRNRACSKTLNSHCEGVKLVITWFRAEDNCKIVETFTFPNVDTAQDAHALATLVGV